MSALSPLAAIVIAMLAVAAAVLLLLYVIAPLLKGIGWLIVNTFRGIGMFIRHIFEFIAGMLGDAIRVIGSLVAMVVLVPLTVLNVVIGRWSAAGHFAESVKRECRVAGACLYRVLLRRPLKLLLLHGVLEGVEQRVPEAMAAAPAADAPSRRAGQFPGYRIVGSLKGGGSGAKLYIAEPDQAVRARYAGMPPRVVIKTFALSEGSSLPQIVRESRALECARQLGLVFEHGMDAQRFYYVMPYHPGDHLGIVTRQLHGEAGGEGLGPRQLATALGYVGDVVQTLAAYHEGGLWHKDIKPENIIVHDGRAHLVDLGLVTPLRSAMTLTTHGTEYFRDPEMVRLALRGVKVHQVNGAKFDIFAAGAVLYFLIENTFPPHGALSRFSKRSPDALRWIVRRAMADYNHRYETADEMLADVHAVAAADDPFAVKPASLPSMSGAAAPTRADIDGAEDDGEAVARAAAHAPAESAPARAVAATAAGLPRPQLRVTNWWTGAYHVEDPRAESVDPAVRAARHGARELRAHATEMRRLVAQGVMPARRAAREQITAARRRAQEIRRNARAARPARHRAVAERQPSAALIIISVVFLSIVALAIGGLFAGAKRSRFHGPVATVIQDAPSAGRPVMLVGDLVDPNDARTAGELDRIVAKYSQQGYDVIRDDGGMREEIHDAYVEWAETKGDEHRAADERLEDLLEQYGLYGILNVHETGWPGAPDWRLRPTLVWSTRTRADQRRFEVAPGPAPTRPYLLVNDHPTKHDPLVEERVAALIAQYEARGWQVIVDDEAEIAVRKAMPPGPIETAEPIVMPEAFDAAVHRAGLGGVLYVHTRPGLEPPAERLRLSRFDAEPIEVEEQESVFDTTSSGFRLEGCRALTLRRAG